VWVDDLVEILDTGEEGIILGLDRDKAVAYIKLGRSICEWKTQYIHFDNLRVIVCGYWSDGDD
jgi:hypothetical protein